LTGNFLAAANLSVDVGFSAPAPQQIGANAKVAGDTGLACARLTCQLDCFALKLFRKQPSFTCHVITSDSDIIPIESVRHAGGRPKLPSTETKALDGKVNTEKFGAVGLVKAFDLAVDLARETCTKLGKEVPFAIYDATSTYGVVNARIVKQSISSLTKNVDEQKNRINGYLDETVLSSNRKLSAVAPLVALAGITSGIKAVADLSALFKTNITAVGTTYGDSTRNLFISALAEASKETSSNCQITGLGAGYIGELHKNEYEDLLKSVRSLVNTRKDFSDSIAAVQKRAKDEKDPKKTELTELATDATVLLKQTDAFLESLKISEVSDKSPLYNAARYLRYASLIGNSNILDFDLRLEGLTITKESVWGGQHVRLSGIAFLWYRLYQQDGTLISAKTLRKVTKPVDIDLRGKDIEDNFWDGPPKQ